MMRVVFCSSEIFPFVKTGGLADVCGALPLALEKLGAQMSLFLPRYGALNFPEENIRKLNNSVSVTRLGGNVEVYLIENESLFGRPGLYGDQSGDYQDNLKRFQFFCRQTLETLKSLNIKSDIIHCHDWQTSLIPVYLKTLLKEDPFFEGSRTILTIHNLAYQGIFPKEKYPQLGLDKKFFSKNGFEFHDQINLLKAGIIFSDRVTTVSPGYAREIQSDELGCGLAAVLRAKEKGILGILNGLDDMIWDPARDRLIAKNFSSDNIAAKQENKKALQEDANLPVRADIPVFSFVGRLDYQKGIELLAQAMDELMKMDLQVVILGVGEQKYHRLLNDLAGRYPKKIVCHLKFDEKKAHQIYAGSDFFLMPSRFEPCGLSQMISLRYGTIPIVFKTGGLADTVLSFDESSGEGNGFVFDKHDWASFIGAVRQAERIYRKKDIFRTLTQKAARHDFSWDRSAKEYQRVYEEC
ncbi:MAG: glycogen synthase GlgA [Candidatus Omnitrophota bacterium]